MVPFPIFSHICSLAHISDLQMLWSHFVSCSVSTSNLSYKDNSLVPRLSGRRRRRAYLGELAPRLSNKTNRNRFTQNQNLGKTCTCVYSWKLSFPSVIWRAWEWGMKLCKQNWSSLDYPQTSISMQRRKKEIVFQEWSEAIMTEIMEVCVSAYYKSDSADVQTETYEMEHHSIVVSGVLLLQWWVLHTLSWKCST